MKLSSSQRCEIAKYADQYGAAETARHFSRKLRKHVSESTVKSIKKALSVEYSTWEPKKSNWSAWERRARSTVRTPFVILDWPRLSEQHLYKVM